MVGVKDFQPEDIEGCEFLRSNTVTVQLGNADFLALRF